MKITNKLPQFEKFPALFITSGEYEAHFHIAFKGELNLQELLKMPPRDDAKEKQAFTARRTGRGISTYTHRGNYNNDLKEKFARKVHDIIHEILAEYQLEEIYIFAPKYVLIRIMQALDKNEQKKVRMQFYKEYTKQNPILLIEILQKEIEKIQNTIIKTPKNPYSVLMK